MTEKLFVNIGNEIHLNGKWWCNANGEHCVDVIIPALNELYEENKQLRFDFKEMKGLLHSFEDEIERLEKENKEIKAKYNRCIEERAVYLNSARLP